MEKKADYSIYIIFIIIALGCFFVYRIYLTIYRYDGYITDHNYYLNDSNNNREKVEKYLKDYLYKKYNKEFTLEKDMDRGSKKKHDFCGVFSCLGVGKVDEIYNYYFIAKDDKGFSFSVDYTNGYMYKKVKYERRIEEDYEVILSVDSIVSQAYDLYNIKFIEKPGRELLQIYLYNESINVDILAQLMNNDYGNYRIYVTNEEKTYNEFNNKTIEYISDLKYKYLRDDNNEMVEDFELFSNIKKDENYFIIVKSSFDIQIGIKEKE